MPCRPATAPRNGNLAELSHSQTSADDQRLWLFTVWHVTSRQIKYIQMSDVNLRYMCRDVGLCLQEERGQSAAWWGSTCRPWAVANWQTLWTPNVLHVERMRWLQHAFVADTVHRQDFLGHLLATWNAHTQLFVFGYLLAYYLAKYECTICYLAYYLGRIEHLLQLNQKWPKI